MSVTNSSRTAALYALLLAGQYVAQTAQALNSPPGKISGAINPRSNRTEKSDGNAESGFDSKTQGPADFGKQKSNFNESHASGIQSTSPVASVELQENFLRNSNVSSNLGGVVHAPNGTVSADSRLANDPRSDPSPLDVLRAQLHKRSVDDKKDLFPEAAEATANDAQTEEHPLISARHKAARSLLGEAAKNLSDEQL